MKFYVEQEILDKGVKIIFAVIRGMDNTGTVEEWNTYRSMKLQELYQRYAELDVHSDPVLEGFNILHDHFSVKRRKNIPASENLIRLLKKNQGHMFFINTAVDIYNLISMDTKLALGAHNMDKAEGDITLRITDGTEKFIPLGQSEPVPVNPGEYCYCDDSNEVLCRLEIRQVNKTAVDASAVNVFYIIQGNEYTPDDLLYSAAREIIETTAAYCKGTGEIIVPEVIHSDTK